MQTQDENYICHIIIPSKDLGRSRTFFEQVFGWKVQQQPGTGSLDVLPPGRKGPSAELNPEVEVVMPSIKTFDIEGRLVAIQKFGGKAIRGKTPIDKNAEHGHYAVFEDPEGNRMCLYSEK